MCKMSSKAFYLSKSQFLVFVIFIILNIILDISLIIKKHLTATHRLILFNTLGVAKNGTS